MRKVYCEIHKKATDIAFKLDEKSEWTEPYCMECLIKLAKTHLTPVTIMEEFENDEPEKCAHCGKSLKGMTMLDGFHYHPRGSYCSKECYDAGCKTKEES